jgi:MscS family membrane protein
MFETLDEVLAGTGEYRWALYGLAGFALLAVTVWLADFVWSRAVIGLTKRTRNQLDQTLATGVRGPLALVILAVGAKLLLRSLVHAASTRATARLEAKDLAVYWTSGLAVKAGEGLLYALVVFSAALLCYALVAAFCDWYLRNVALRTNSRLDDELVPLVRRAAKVVVFFAALTMVLGHFGVELTALLGAAGFASLAVALAAQDTVANMISGVTILVDRPFRVGDRVELSDGVIGDVTDIGLRTTKILSFDSTQLIIPNKEISSARIVNHSYPDPKVKLRKRFSAAYGSDAAKVKAVLVAVASEHPKVRKDPVPAAYFVELGSSSLNFLLVCWIDDYRDKLGIEDGLNTEVVRRFQEEGIEIPFPQMDLHIRSGLERLPRGD